MIIRKAVIAFVMVGGLFFALPIRAQEKPLTLEQVQSLARNGLADQSGAKLIVDRGIDFEMTPDLLDTLKTAGASPAFLATLVAAKQPETVSAKKPLHLVQILALVAGGVPTHRVAMLVVERGINFDPSPDDLDEIRLGGGDEDLLAAIKKAVVVKPAVVDPANQARQGEIEQHVAHGAEFEQKGQYAESEQEYRAALLLNPQDADVYISLSYVLRKQGKLDDSEAAAREAVRLSPSNDNAHASLGLALSAKGDRDGEIKEVRESLRLNPNVAEIHNLLGVALIGKGDTDGAIAEYREAIRINPDFSLAHNDLGDALRQKGDNDGAIAEFREALRLNPNSDMPHIGMAQALGAKGDIDGAIVELRGACRADPNDELAHFFLGGALADKGDKGRRNRGVA